MKTKKNNFDLDYYLLGVVSGITIMLLLTLLN